MTIALLALIALVILFAVLFARRRPSVPITPQPEPEVRPERRYGRITVPRFDGGGDAPPFTWKPCHASTMQRFKAQMTCPKGHGLILKGHTIDERGVVSPSVVCLTPGCDFHEFVQLTNWDFGAIN